MTTISDDEIREALDLLDRISGLIRERPGMYGGPQNVLKVIEMLRRGER